MPRTVAEIVKTPGRTWTDAEWEDVLDWLFRQERPRVAGGRILGSAAASDAWGDYIVKERERARAPREVQAAAQAHQSDIGAFRTSSPEVVTALGQLIAGFDPIAHPHIDFLDHVTHYFAQYCINRKGRRRFEQPAPLSDGDHAVPSRIDNAEEELIALVALDECIQKLPSRLRALVDHISVHGTDQRAEVAAAIGVRPASVRVHLNRALQRLRACLGANGTDREGQR